MSKLTAPFILFTTLFFLSCKKDKAPVTVAVVFDQTIYDTLGTFDASGKPSDLLLDTVSSGLKNFIDTMLTEKTNLSTKYPELLSTSAIADVKITKPSDVYITFVAHGTKYANTFAFYTYTTGSSPTQTKDIKNITYVFPNAGAGTPLKKGDKIKIGRFEPGISLGFVLLQNAWNTTTHTIDNKVVHFLTNDALNPEVDASLKKHAVLINYVAENKTLIGFEDIYRTDALCDHDFNDLLLYCTVKPAQ